MIYNEFKGKKISALGLGCMRLPTKGQSKDIDLEKTRELIAYAMKSGINYYDTAWGYHEGRSEPVMGEILSEYPRESFYLASKFPGYDLSNMSKVKEIFTKQLERCRVDYFDFYLFHSVTEENIDEYLNPENNIYNYLIEQKNQGRIKHLGFSTHGTLATIKRFLDSYGAELEFCQLQVNWLDWTFQRAREKVELVKSYGIPVFVMEPVRGGRLLRLDQAHEKRLKKLAPERTMPEWAFRFIQGIPEVTLTLSGMSNMEQLEENIRTFEEKILLTKEELEALSDIADEIVAKNTLPCTACSYCTSKCPMGLDIPYLIDLYNDGTSTGMTSTAKMALKNTDREKLPSVCVGCRACEAVCPQGIKISEAMTHLADRLAK